MSSNCKEDLARKELGRPVTKIIIKKITLHIILSLQRDMGTRGGIAKSHIRIESEGWLWRRRVGYSKS